jgi:hypothetical protein
MRISRVYRCAAVGAEGVSAFVAAFGRFDVDLGSSGSHNEAGCGRLYIDSIGGPGERLAISAVTNPNRVRVDLDFKGNLAAVATAFDFHGCPRERTNPREVRIIMPLYRLTSDACGRPFLARQLIGLVGLPLFSSH